VLAYLATKDQFLRDAPTIEDIVEEAVRSRLGIRVGPNEKTAWRNSLGNAMSHFARDPRIPAEAGVAIEYRLNGRRFRIDFMVSGEGSDGRESLVIIELKQWSGMQKSVLRDHVRTFVGGAVRDERHPSYQAWSYARHLSSYNEYVYSSGVNIAACAYLHNCEDPSVVRDGDFAEWTTDTPVFIKGELEGLVRHVSGQIVAGHGADSLQRVDQSPIRPSKPLAEAIGNMLKGQSEFVLVDEQKTVLESIVAAATRAQVDKKQVLIIHGGPGTGKSVIAINALARLTSLRKRVRYVTPNAAPRSVFEKILQRLLSKEMLTGLFSGSASYTHSAPDSFDMLIVDEAHRLKKRHQYSKGGVNQIKEIIEAARATVFFIDEAQQVTWQDIGDVATIETFAHGADADVTHLALHSQFRCNGSDDYLVWLDDTLGVRKDNTGYFSRDRYDFRIFDDPSALHATIREKNRSNNKSRMVAGYCWDWVSKSDTSQADLVFPEFKYEAKWNLLEHGGAFVIEVDSVSEVGCIHTCQGLELDYVGVIVGPDLVVRDGELATDPSARAKTDKSLHGFKKALKEDPRGAAQHADMIIRNTYRTLMTRGMKGCYVYFTDTETRDYFRSRVPAMT
jgi:DUF2075 family protein/thymidine kinase